ncbi:MAG: hypothetical protein NUV65_02020 [Candidatus Roizmanbacteria bacterium]|nr:hypothetical protein [Candidatus Roizmanbacteria bacterium]
MGVDNSSALGPRIIRHILDGNFDPATLRRGAEQIAKLIVTPSVEVPELTGPYVQDNFLGHESLTVALYRMPSALAKISTYKINFRFFMFPESWKFNIGLTSSSISTKEYMGYNKGIVSSFFGPTHREHAHDDRVPNNGFTYEGDVLNPFMETDPLGQRRGAIVVYKNGVVRLVNDAEKWHALSNSQGIKAISGTSDYFEDTDAPTHLDQHDRPRHATSFLIQDKGTGRLVYLPVVHPLERKAVFSVVKTFSLDFDIDAFTAVELDHNGAAIYVRDNKSSDTYVYPIDVTNHRRDHYGFEK